MKRLMLALVLASGCRPGIELQTTVSEHISTVITVEWTTPEPTDAHVEFGHTKELGRRSKTTSGTEHKAILIGLSPEQVVYLQVVTDTDTSPLTTVTTGALSADLPQLTLTGDPDALPGYLVVPLMGTTGLVVIINRYGDIVWHTPLAPRDLSYRAWLDRSEEIIAFNRFDISGQNAIIRQPLDGSEAEVLDFQPHNHDFLVLPDGDLAVIGRVEQSVDGEMVPGDGIYRVDRSGESTLLWSAWDDFTYAGLSDDLGGWTHANALDYYPDEDAFYLSLRSFDAIIKLEASTGALDWVLSGDPTISDFTYAEGATPTSHQHQFERLAPDRILSFDNRYDLQEPARVVEFALDLEERVAEEVWTYQHEPALSVYALGDVDRREDGSTLVDWSTSGVIQYLSPEGEELWRLNTELGYAFGYVSLLRSLDE
ncbi:MAG: aryl-sulfate sulfotransferase [Myxococcota bacterium]|nr:aryl-sulfate sulfotransferase [Myxococcota bacterium]